MVWLCSDKADFLHGRMVWANWDVDEMVAKKEEIVSKDLLTIDIKGSHAHN